MTTSPAISVLLFALGLAVVLAVFSSVLRTLVVPRGLPSKLSTLVLKATLGVFRAVARRTGTYEARDRIMAFAAPLSLILMLVLWLLVLLLGYSLMLFSFSPLDWASSVREAGSSLFTLGFASTDRTQLTGLDFAAAATGPIIVGLLVGYLPSLYSAYNRREVDVALLHSRSGEPNWGPEILLRHAAVNTVEQLEILWRTWERWSADVAESHINYRVLIHVRSAQPMRNWLVALLAVMDAAALHLALNPQLPQGAARVALRQGFVAVQDLARVEGIDVDVDPDPDTPIDVTLEDFVDVCVLLAANGYPMAREPAAAYTHFRGWRVNYERAAYALANRIDAVPARWSGVRTPPLPVIAPNRPVNRLPGGGSGRLTPGQ